MTTLDILAAGRPADPAIRAPGQVALGFAALRDLTARTISRLNQLGFGRGDRLAIVLPNGPHLATAFLAVASGASAAPLNPAYTEAEFAFALADLGANALIVDSEGNQAAEAAAARLKLPRIRLRASPAMTGLFELEGQAASPVARPGPAAPGDVALLLHTSGTTSRPKLVALTRANLTASAANIARSLALSPADCCLNLMPLFHVHGLMASLLASLAAGASVVCTPGFDALKFFAWLDAEKPTWFTAVPTMHQAIIARAGRNADAVARANLRLVRSSSAPLPRHVMAQLETLFRCPAIEAYGMTEAAHQIASNPLPGGVRKAGSVGVAAGARFAIMDAAGNLLDPDRAGEIVIAGDGVIAGYENGAGAAAIASGWLRTGDQGRIDCDGYLWITGRLKEIINRGGEKIAPREVEDVFVEHPSVQQVVAFALPHEALGEDVAAAIVLRDGCRVSAHELRDFAAPHLAAFKVPRTLVFVDAIPLGPTGKPQRNALAKLLGLA